MTFFINFTYAAYPEFEFLPQNFPAGQVDIVGKSSSGTQVELFVNDLTIGTLDVIGNETLVVLDGSSIQNQVLTYGSTIIFRNEGPRNYQLNISGVYKELAFGDELTYVGTQVGDIMFVDNVEGISRIISVTNNLVDFKFDYINDYLQNGQNDLKFIQKYPYLTYSNQSVFEYTINFEKYTNDITVTNFTNVTNQHSGFIQGYVESVTYPMYYLKNINPNELGNIGALNEIELVGDRFNISLDNLQEGENLIYLITTDPNDQNIFTGMKKVSVFVDTLPPELNIKKVSFEKAGNTYTVDFSSNVYLNGNRLNLEIETDAVLINYTFNNETFIEDEIINESVNITLNLDEGINPLILEAIDIAGNTMKESHNIYFDDTQPDIVRESLKPDEMFGSSSIAHFFFQDIEGRTNKGDVELTIFTLPYGSETMDGVDVNCKDYEDLFLRNLGQLDRERVDGPELNMNETQLSLTNFMFQKVTTSSDSDGNFDALIGLQEKDFTRKEYNDVNKEKTQSEEIDSVESRNRICFVMYDKYGNFNIHEEKVTLDAGNTMWRPGEITTIPNTIYASEIENAGDQRNDGDNVEFSVIARFQYIGADKVNSLTSFRISEDTATSEHSKYVSIDSGRTKYSLDTDSGELTAYFVVEVSPMGIKPLDYPDSLNLAFEARPVYTVGDYDVPIDTTNPIYFQTTVNVESPLDHTKWLTPEMIDEALKFLEKSIEYTEKAIEWTGIGSVAGVLACTGAKFWFVAATSTLEEGSQEYQEEKSLMFQICDRVMCSSAPDECEKLEEEDFLDVSEKDKYSSEALIGNNKAEFVSRNAEDKEILGRVTDLNVDGYDPNCKIGNKSGAVVDLEIKKYTKDGTIWQSSTTSSSYERNKCVEAIYKDVKTKKECVPTKENSKTCKVASVNLQKASGVCYTELEPNYDEARCPMLGFDTSNPLYGWDPKDNIIESVGCGCITDTYSHLKNYLKIQQAIKGCLEQAKIGETQGSYCERLMGQAVCDVATNVMFKTAGHFAERTGPDGKSDPHSITGILANIQDSDRILNDRYEGTFYDQMGLGTEQIVNKVCLGAVTGDWSALTDNILSGIDQNEVEPVFGPLLAESRLQGYDPFSGAVSIRYTFTYAAVSGGQRIDSSVEFICDSSQPGGEYCPDGRYTSEQLDSSFNMPRLYVSDGGSVQDTVVITDTQARYRYNIVQVTHKYQLGKETKEQVVTENIFAKGESMIANCYFTGGAMGEGSGFHCDTLFDNDALSSAYKINKDNTKLIPQAKTTYYPHEPLFLKLGYSVLTDDRNSQTEFDLAYKVQCPSANSGGDATHLGYKTIQIDEGEINGNVILKLLDIPDVSRSESTYDGEVKYQLKGNFIEGNSYSFKFENKLSDQKVRLIVGNAEDPNYIFDSDCSPDNSISLDPIPDKSSVSDGSIKFCRFTVKQNSSILKFKFGGDLDKITENFVNPGDIGKVSFDRVNVFDNPTSNFDIIGPGTCKITFKLLASGKGVDAMGSAEVFDNISNYPENVINSDNIDTQGDYILDFRVAKTLEDIKDRKKQNYIEFYNPFSGDSVCVEKDGNIDLNFIYQSLEYADLSSVLSIKWALERYDYGSEIYEDLTSPDVDDNKYSLTLSQEAINALLNDGSSQKMTLAYKVKNDDITEPILEDSFQFNIQVKEDCEDGSFFDTKYNLITNSEKEGETKTNGDGIEK